MTLYNILSYIDWTLFVFVAMTVFYLGFYAVTSLFARNSETPKAKNLNRFIIVILSHHNGKSTVMTVKSILGQSYAQRLFDVTVVANREDEMTLFKLAQEPVTLLTSNFDRDSRTKSLQLAINNLPQFKIYDVVLVLEAGDVVETEFLAQMNDAYEAAGTRAIQAHKLSLNRDTTAARLDAVFEEINNSIFRRGHISIGMPSAIASSGMAFDFTWFKRYIHNAKVSWGDKELEAMLMRQHVYVDYFDHIYVYNEKTRQAEEFNRQHKKWMGTQLRTIIRNIRHLPLALLNRHYAWVDKLLQWMLMPRIVMMSIMGFMSIVVPFFRMYAALKWWGLFALVVFIFAIGTPNYLVDDKWDSTFFKVPVVLFSSVLKKFRLGRKFIDIVNLKQ